MKDDYIEKKPNGWIYSHKEITQNDLIDHLEYKRIIGLIPYYKEIDKWHYKWICIDIDCHDNNFTKGNMGRINYAVKTLLGRSEELLLC